MTSAADETYLGIDLSTQKVNIVSSKQMFILSILSVYITISIDVCNAAVKAIDL